MQRRRQHAESLAACQRNGVPACINGVLWRSGPSSGLDRREESSELRHCSNIGWTESKKYYVLWPSCLSRAGASMWAVFLCTSHPPKRVDTPAMLYILIWFIKHPDINHSSPCIYDNQCSNYPKIHNRSPYLYLSRRLVAASM